MVEFVFTEREVKGKPSTRIEIVAGNGSKFKLTLHKHNKKRLKEFLKENEPETYTQQPPLSVETKDPQALADDIANKEAEEAEQESSEPRKQLNTDSMFKEMEKVIE